MLWAAHGGGRVEGQDAAGREPVEHHPNGGEVLLDGRGGMPVAEVLDISRDVDRQVIASRVGSHVWAAENDPLGRVGSSPVTLTRSVLLRR